jgi:hypothetical protein
MRLSYGKVTAITLSRFRLLLQASYGIGAHGYIISLREVSQLATARSNLSPFS